MKVICGINLDDIACFIEPQQIVILDNGNRVELTYSYFLEVKEKYKTYIENKRLIYVRNKVIKEAFEYVWKCKWEMYANYLPLCIKNKDIRIDIYPAGMSVSCTKVKIEPVDFNFNSTCKKVWIRYAQDIKDAYLDSLVDPVKIANQVLEFRKLDNKWGVLHNTTRFYTLSVNLIRNDGKEYISLFENPEKKKLTLFSLYHSSFAFELDVPTTNSEWCNVINFALDKYYGTKVDPVAIAKELLEARGLKTNEFKCFIFGDGDIRFNYPSYHPYICYTANAYSTKEKWVSIVNSHLDKYLQYLTDKKIEQNFSKEVELKLMLAKALKDNSLVAKEVTIPNADSFCKALVKFEPNGYIKWVHITGENTIKCNLNGGYELHYSIPPTLEDWQYIFFYSLAQYKKLTQPKLTKNDIIKCLESALDGLSVESISGTLNDSLVGTIEIKLVGYKTLIWEISENSIIAKNYKESCGFAVPFVCSPKTKEDWQTLFKTSLEQLLPVSKEPNLFDLIKKAFPSYNLELTSKVGKYTFYKGNNNNYYLTVEVLNDKVSSFIVLNDNGSHCYFSLCLPHTILTTENLTNYSNWEQWLDNLIKLKQNLKDLEQSPGLVVKAMKQLPQRKSVWTAEGRDKYNLGDDPWL